MNPLAVIEYQAQRVLTTAQLAEAFGTDTQNISKNFTRNAERYTTGKHYFALDGEEKRSFLDHVQIDDGLKNASVVYLWTEKGAWMHAKSLNTDEAWAAYETLVDDYYTIKRPSIDVSRLTPQMQMFHHMFEAVAGMELQLQETTQKLDQVSETVHVMQETFLQRDPDWRKQMDSLLRAAGYRMGGGQAYSEVRSDSYRLLEERARCDLAKRLRNLITRLEEAGATKTQIAGANRMDVIEDDPRLKEIYGAIVKELSIGSLHVAK